mgnify:CR=1 FL=1
MKEILNISVIMQHRSKDILEDIIIENIISIGQPEKPILNF